MFDRFYKVDPARLGDSAGSGLGLSIVRAIVERHGGSVTVTSGGSTATVFTVCLPAARLAYRAVRLFLHDDRYFIVRDQVRATPFSEALE